MFDHEISINSDIEFIMLSCWVEAILIELKISLDKVVCVRVPNTVYEAYFDSLLSKWVLKKGSAPNDAPKMPPKLNSNMSC